MQARHVFLLLCQFVNYMEVVRLPVYYPSEQEKEDPKLYANNVRKLISMEVFLWSHLLWALGSEVHLFNYELMCSRFPVYDNILFCTEIWFFLILVWHAALNVSSLPNDRIQKDDWKPLLLAFFSKLTSEGCLRCNCADF